MKSVRRKASRMHTLLSANCYVLHSLCLYLDISHYSRDKKIYFYLLQWPTNKKPYDVTEVRWLQKILWQ